MQGIRLNEYALKIQLAKELPQHRPFVVLPGGVAGLTDGHTKGGGVQRDLSNECRAAAGRRLDRASQGLAVTHQLVKVACPTRDLSNCPVPDCGAQGSHVNLSEEVAES